MAVTNDPRNPMADQRNAAWLFAAQLIDVKPIRATAALAMLLAFLALALRLYGLSDKPLWFDEIITLNRANLPVSGLVIDALEHKHYPTYFLLLSPFTSVNVDAWTLRIPSALFGAACTFLVTLLAAEIRGAQAGLVAGLLMALSPFEVQFGQEARSYTLISCLVLIAIWGLVRVAHTPVASALPLSQPAAQRGAWAAYVLGTLGALLVHNCAIPWLLASNMSLLVIAHRAPSERRELLRNWAWAQAIILLIWLPGLIIMLLSNRGAALSGVGWIPRASYETIWSVVSALYLFRISDMMTFDLLPAPLPGFGAGVAVFALLGAWRLKANPRSLTVVGLAFLAMPVAISVMSAFQPMLVPRYLMWSTSPFFVFAGIGAASLPTRFFPLAAVIVAGGGALSLAPYFNAETKPRWDRAVAFLVDNSRPQDVIVAQNQSVKYVLDSYAERLRLDSRIPVHASNSEDAAQRAKEGERAWIVYGRYGQEKQEPEEGFRQKWSALGIPAEEVWFGSHILILRFDKVASEPVLEAARRETARQ
jgi:mannosyltransferase